MRALVTGAHGFVGRWLTAHLEASGDEVIDLPADVDVVDSAAVRKSVLDVEPEAIYHLAARTHVGQSWETPEATFMVNAVGTVNVLEAARHVPTPPRVLIVSSAEVYGAARGDNVPLSEESPLRPVTPYAASKVAAEFAGIQAYLGGGVPVVVARPFNHIGPGQAPTFAASEFAHRIVEAERTAGTQLRIGNPTPRRDFTDVRDVVRAYRLLIDRGEPGLAYNVCSAHDVAIGDLAARLIAAAGIELEIVVDADLSRPVDVPVVRGDASRLNRATGWAPEIALDRTLADVLAYWRAVSEG